MNSTAKGIKQSCTSPKTARFSSLQAAGQLLQMRQSKLGDASASGNASRDNIKMNTKNIMQEIGDLDQEIAQLQGTLLTALQPNITDPDH